MRTTCLLLFMVVSGCSTASSDSSADAGSMSDASTPSDGGTPFDFAVPADASTRSLSANDVSVLFPIQTAASVPLLWAADTEGNGGALLPRATFDQIAEPFNPQHMDPASAYAALRVVSLRFDPCFPGAPCQAQIRLVMQTVDPTDGRAEDGAIHLLYNLTHDEFASLLVDLRALTAHSEPTPADAPLGPNPTLMVQGLDGDYAQGLRALVTRYAGATTLARMTFMTRTNSRASTWHFGGFNLREFSPTGPISIVGLPSGTTQQQVLNGAAAVYNYAFTPVQAAQPAVLTVLSADTIPSLSPSALADAHEALALIDNPSLSSPESIDCASCHVARRIRDYLSMVFPADTAPTSAYEGEVEAHHVLGGADANPDNLRAFGYFDRAPAVSQRVANESHAVLANIESMYP